jgi:hypothetical protein
VSIDLRDLLRGLRLDIPADARDAALLSVGWAAALRRSDSSVSIGKSSATASALLLSMNAASS